MDIKFWNDLSEDERRSVLTRPAQTSSTKVQTIVEDIISRICEEGDSALFEFSKNLDHYEGDSLELTETEIEKACSDLSPDLKNAIDTAYENIKNFHAAQNTDHVELETFPGIVCQTATHPIDSVGLYVPGGSAPLVSTALMLGVPAQVAGCAEVILCSPPPISNAIIYAARKAGVKRIFNLGGAQAIAAMAYGTATVPKVLKIFGPGNQFVTMAKRLVSNDPNGAAIDMPAGPSEVLVIADNNAQPSFVAADLLSQAEHGPDSQVILVSDSEEFVTKAVAEVDRQLTQLPRKEIAHKALSKSTAIVVETLEDAVAVSNKYAPEHLILQVEDPDALIPFLHNAGSIFVGAFTPESLGDYASGTNHTLPTYGYAHTYSALGTADYRRRYTIQRASAEGLKAIAPVVETLADAEGLGAHKNAVTVRVSALNK
ncbi:MAG: histidinol dehydrogenase [Succinivibrio sp.]|nr:histidinol dehydrogenase [Succinivibrio sp.]